MSTRLLAFVVTIMLVSARLHAQLTCDPMCSSLDDTEGAWGTPITVTINVSKTAGLWSPPVTPPTDVCPVSITYRTLVCIDPVTGKRSVYFKLEQLILQCIQSPPIPGLTTQSIIRDILRRILGEDDPLGLIDDVDEDQSIVLLTPQCWRRLICESAPPPTIRREVLYHCNFTTMSCCEQVLEYSGMSCNKRFISVSTNQIMANDCSDVLGGAESGFRAAEALICTGMGGGLRPGTTCDEVCIGLVDRDLR